MCSFGDLDPCSVWRETPRKARKGHECDGCWSAITPGQPYLEHFNVFDGAASTEHMCAPCWFARAQFADAHGQLFTPSMLREVLRDCIGENDDPDDVWRPVLAGVLKRYRTSPSRKRALERSRMEVR